MSSMTWNRIWRMLSIRFQKKSFRFHQKSFRFHKKSVTEGKRHPHRLCTGVSLAFCNWFLDGHPSPLTVPYPYCPWRACPCLSLAVHGYPWLSMPVLGCTWLYMAVHACPWLSMPVLGCPCWEMAWNNFPKNFREGVQGSWGVPHRSSWNLVGL